jgi:hypothetical protein
MTPITIGTHRNGQTFARMELLEASPSVTVEGTGQTEADARDDLVWRLRQLADAAEDAWCQQAEFEEMTE